VLNDCLAGVPLDPVVSLRLLPLAQSCDEQLDQATCVVAGGVVGTDAEIADAAHEFVGIHVGANLAGLNRGAEQLRTHRHEAVDEVGVQRVESGVVRLQHGSESVLGDQEINKEVE